MMPKSLDWASFVSACIVALKREESWVLVVESVSGSWTSLLARSSSFDLGSCGVQYCTSEVSGCKDFSRHDNIV